MEKVYKTMRNTGAGSIVLGILTLIVGITVGVLSILNGSILLRRKDEITF